MQVFLDSSFARPGSPPIWSGKKGEFRDWTKAEFERGRKQPKVISLRNTRDFLRI